MTSERFVKLGSLFVRPPNQVLCFFHCRNSHRLHQPSDAKGLWRMNKHGDETRVSAEHVNTTAADDDGTLACRE